MVNPVTMVMEEQATTIAARREILDWRDRHETAVLIVLPRAWQDSRRRIEAKLEDIGWQELITAPDAFIGREIDPLIEGELGPVVRRLLAEAQAELGTVLEAQTAVDGMPALADAGDAARDVLASLGPLVAGIGVAAALPTTAVVTGAAFFGLVATSAISVPVLLGGVALAGVGVATGAINTRDLRAKRLIRMRERVAAHVDEAVLSPDHAGSLTARLLGAYRSAAEGIDHAE